MSTRQSWVTRRRKLRALDFLTVTHEDYREANWALVTELVEGKRRQFQIEKKVSAQGRQFGLGKQQRFLWCRAPRG